MTQFKYQHGDRPLKGYTIEHALGRGGFGEVYFATSDAGREVALKALMQYEDIELRGISHCMNLKSPHLVSIFDVKENDDGQPFVIMEYVSGPSLWDLLQDAPSGLGTDKAAFFLREMAKGLTFLHDRGIVHRDLKPHNVFYEDGIVKIGDYSLSKAMSDTHHSAHTITVGSVHYMAPEIGQGIYGRSIDIYALGVMLYEMLTGQAPYRGSSPGEIMMKHLTGKPDVSGIEEPFAHVILKAMATDPEDRYETVQEMVEDVFGAEHVRNSVGAFGPGELTEVARRAAKKVSPRRTPAPPVPALPTPAVNAHAEERRNRPVEPQPLAPAPMPDASDDVLKHRQLGVIILLMIVTLGLYGFYLIPALGESVNRLTGKQKHSFGLVLLLGIVTCGLALSVFEILYAYDLEKDDRYTDRRWSNQGLGQYVLILNVVSFVVAFASGFAAFAVSLVLGLWATWLIQEQVNKYLEHYDEVRLHARRAEVAGVHG